MAAKASPATAAIPRDLISSLHDEVARKRRSQTETKPPASKRYMTRGDLERERERKYLEEQNAKREAEQKLLRERVQNTLRSVSEPEEKQETEGPELLLPVREVMARLRQRGQPITLFGEDDHQRAHRLHKLEEREPMEYVAGTDNEILKSIRAMETGDEPKKPKENECGAPFVIPDKCATVEEEIMVFFKKLLNDWNEQLAEKPEAERRSSQGKLATATFQQCYNNVLPFFDLLNAKTVADDILIPVIDIVKFLKERDYVKANDAYLGMAIGNAPWPMGVTMVGIHERSAREKIFSKSVAHILNDETTRKYLQSIKRLMTFCQQRYPTDPSRCVEYVPKPRVLDDS
ncbi:pre-mRNA-splicing factor 18 [Pelomyxa schiedti]|nr:pre-mRNA-splicing factor 18 [Pelomyxa schiedti]